MVLKFELPPSGFKRLFYDIETSYEVGRFWRPSFKAVIRHTDVFIESAIICISYKWETQKEVKTLRWDAGNDKELVKKFIELALTADEIIGHNGDNFDEKIIRTRALFHGLSCPPKFPSLDTLKKARKHFRMDSNTLQYISKRLTGAGKDKMEYNDWDLICKPLIGKHFGFKITLPDSYNVAMDKMVKYCELDVFKLEQVFHQIQPYIDHNHHAGALDGFGRWSCGKCGNDSPTYQKKYITKTGTIKHRLKCGSIICASYYTVSNAVWLKKLEADYNEKQGRANLNG